MRHFGKLLLIIFIISVCNCTAQSIFEHLPNRPEQSTVLLIGYTDDLKIENFGSASIYQVPFSTNIFLPCLVTAKHILTNEKTGKMIDGLLAKINMPHGSKPRYVKVPLKHDSPRNYWTSPSNLDIAVIPLPYSILKGSDMITFTEDQIVTFDKVIALNIVPGLIVRMFCVQSEFEDYMDYLMPETFPVIRFGHLSRLGFYSDGIITNIRSHIIDIHSSFGNSGATVQVLVPDKNGTVSIPMFLGIVQGFKEEKDAYRSYNAPVTTTSNIIKTISLINEKLINEKQEATNHFALAIKTLANPNLSFITPGYELTGIKNSISFLIAERIMLDNQNKYLIYNTIPPVK